MDLLKLKYIETIAPFTCMFYILDEKVSEKPTFISKIVTEIQISYQKVKGSNQHQWPLGSQSKVTEEASR